MNGNLSNSPSFTDRVACSESNKIAFLSGGDECLLGIFSQNFQSYYPVALRFQQQEEDKEFLQFSTGSSLTARRETYSLQISWPTIAIENFSFFMTKL